MILFIGIKNELTIHDVYDWIDFYDEKFESVNQSDIEYQTSNFILSNDNADLSIQLENKRITFDEINSVWYRKSRPIQTPDISSVSKKTERNLQFYLEAEAGNFKKGIFNCLSSKYCLGNPHVNNINKIFALLKAKEANLKIPKTFIVQSKKEWFFDKSRELRRGN